MLYKCEICGRLYRDIEEAQKCEARGYSEELVKVGDIIYFKDCKDTPILYSKLYEYLDKGIRPPKYIEYAYDHASINFNILQPFEVYKIVYKGHDIYYYLIKIPGKSYSFYFNYIDYTNAERDYWYPEIKGNEFMQKIIDKYNS